MTKNRPFPQVLERWLDEGPEAAPELLLETALAAVSTRPQYRRGRNAVRRLHMLSTTGQRIAAIAAVVVLAAVSVSYLGSRGPATIGPTQAPSATSTAVVGSPTPAPSAISTPAATGPASIADVSMLQAGVTYSAGPFSPAFTFRGVDGWIVRTVDGATVILYPPGTITGGTFMILRPGAVLDVGGAAAAVPKDLGAWIRARSDLALAAPSSVKVGGIAATLFDGTVKPGATTNSGGAINLACEAPPSGCYFENGSGLGFGTGDHFQIVALTVHGQQLLIDMSANSGSWGAVKDQMRTVLASIVFTGG